MASPCSLIEDGSDANCEVTCNLQYGTSEVFNQNVIQEQTVKASKSRIKPQVFDDPNEQAN